MATLSHSESRRMYSWWWDSHISPKSSKWLQENLYDMDSKVKAMIKLIEEDADTFARRAEMYYKKRPELMKLVEEFYRAYRALAERYSSATGVLRQAHSTMVEVCPDQVPFVLPDDSPGNTLETDPHTPHVPIQSRAGFYPDSVTNHDLELSSPNWHASELKQFSDFLGSEGKVRKGLNFQDTESEVVVKFEKDIQVLKDALAKLDADKEAGLANFQQSLERLSKLESEVSRAQEDSKRVDGQSRKAESEVQILREALGKLEAEKNASLLHYQHSLERFSKLETDVSLAQADSKRVDEQAHKANGEVQTLKEALCKLEAEKEASFVGYQWSLERLSKLEAEFFHAQEDHRRVDERAKKAEDEVETLKEALNKLEAEKEVSLFQYQQCLGRIADLESTFSLPQDDEYSERALKAEAEAESLKEVLRIIESEKEAVEKKLLFAEEDSKKQTDRAVAAEEQVEALKQALNKLTEEKEAAFVRYQQCLESISNLEDKLSRAEEEVQRLNGELESEAAKLKNAEERSLVLEKLCESQSEELTEKQKEMGRLWASIQEERLRFMEAETALQSLQLSHSQTQEELKSLTSELHNRAVLNQSLQDEVTRMKEKTKNLNEFNSSSAISMKEIQNEIFSLQDIRGKLEEEVELQAGQRNALQQEISSLKEELNELNQKYQDVLEENSNLKEASGREIAEKKALLEKMELMEELLRKNTLMENSLTVLSAELEEAREKKNSLEKSFRSVLQKKSLLRSENNTLSAQLKEATENLDRLSEKNTFLENSLISAHEEHTELKARSKSLEESCRLLENEKCDLIKENLRVLQEGQSSKKECLALKEEIRTLEGEIFLVLGETLSSSTLSLILNNIINERSKEGVDGDRVQISEEKLEEADFESLHRREVELSEVARKLVATEIEKSALEKVVADLRSDLEEVQMIRHEREMQILKLSENNHHLNMENECLHELQGARRSLKDGTSSRDAHIGLLQERVRYLEGENGNLKCQLAVYAQATIALKDSVSSLESSTSMQTLLQKTRDNTTKVEEMSSRSSTESFKAKSNDRDGPDTVSELKDLLHRIRSAEKSVIKMRKIAAKETINTNAKLEAATNLIEDLKLRRASHPEVQPTPEPSEGGFLMKDIVLDKVSEPSSIRTRRSESEEADYLLESWDTTLDRSIGLTVGKGKTKIPSARFEGHRRYSSKGTSIEDLSVDKSEISRTPSLPRQEVNKRKILDRLNSDVQKLSNLQITVQDLTKRVDGSKKNKNHDEWDTLKDQLEEAEESIQKLFDVQSKLKRSAEEKSTMEADETGSFRRRKISEKAKRVSEKIGRLQLEVQKMQFVLLKLDDETDKGKKGRTRIVESKRRVLLRDYLYGGGRTSLRKKRAACCGCVQPSTRE